MTFIVREMSAADRMAWIGMRGALWPDDTQETHAEAVDALLKDGEAWAFLAEAGNGEMVGFAEVAVRKYANGCDTRPVAVP